MDLTTVLLQQGRHAGPQDRTHPSKHHRTPWHHKDGSGMTESRTRRSGTLCIKKILELVGCVTHTWIKVCSFKLCEWWWWPLWLRALTKAAGERGVHIRTTWLLNKRRERNTELGDRIHHPRLNTLQLWPAHCMMSVYISERWTSK